MTHGLSRIFLITACFLAFMSVSQPSLAQSEDSFLRKWFPILFGEDSEPGPEDTLVAPFAENQEEKISENKKSPPVLGSKEKPLDKPHISYEELQTWVVRKVSTGMNFDDETFESSVTSLKPFFTQQALQEYINFLDQQGIYSQVINNNKVLNSTIAELPVLTYWDESCPGMVSEFTHNGRYHWRFDVNVVYGIMDKTTTSYDQMAEASGNNVTVQVVVSRVPYSDNPTGLKILSWKRARPC